MLTKRPRDLALGALVLVGLYSLSLYSYLLFHTAAELAGIVVLLGLFLLAWNFRRSIDNNYLLFTGIAALPVAVLAVMHTLAYKGMNVFTGFDANLPTQLWIATRAMLSITFVIAPFTMGRPVRPAYLLAGYVGATVALVWTIFAGYFPDCFIEGSGLTPFKKVSEYVISFLFLLGLGLLVQRRDDLDRRVYLLLAWFLGLSIAEELMFTLYVGVYDHFNLTGHLIQVVTYALLYSAIVETGLTKPYSLLFRNLKLSEEALKVERNFVSAVLENAGALIIVIDLNGRIVRFNRACEELSGYGSAEVVGRTLAETVIPPEGLEANRRLLERLRGGTSGRSGENHWLTKQGDRRLILWNTSAITGDDGAVKYVVGTGVDVTERRRMEEELKERESRLRVMVESVRTGMFLIDRQTKKLVDVNPAAAELIGLPAESVIGRRCTDFLRCTDAAGSCPLDEDGHDHGHTEPVLVTSSGREVPIHRTAVAVPIGGRPHLMVSFVDMTEHKLIEEELRRMSLVDDLTGLYNRRGFLSLAQKEINTSLRLKRGMVLLFIDLANLDDITDARGHIEGDRAIQAAAQIIRDAFSETGLIARIGENEFVVLAPQYVGVEPSMLVSRLEQRLELHNGAYGRNYEIRLSTGVARLNPDKPCSIHDLLTQADTMLYVEKRRNQIERLRSTR